MQDNDIIKLLGIKDATIKIISVSVKGTEKTVEFEKRLELHYCPLCGCRMHSKGISRRKKNHPILQDGYTLTMIFNQRRWQCSNKSCREIITDEVSFIDKRKRNARGYRNFEHIRNRFLFARRKNAEMLGHPKPWKEVCFSTGIKRGPYKKAAKGPKLKK